MTSENRSTELQEFLVQLSENSIDDVDFTDFISAASENGDTALHGAIWSRNFEVAREMVKLGIDVNAVGDMDDTPLHVAVRKGLLELTMFLMDHGADPLAVNEFGQTSVECAARFEHTEILDYLRVVTPKSDKLTALVDTFSDNPEPRNYGRHLQNAILNGDTELAKELVKLGADEKFEVGSCGRRPIHFAVMMGNVELTKFMTKKGYVGQRDEDGFSPLCLAEIFGHQEIADYLREVRKRILEQGLRRAQRLASKD